MEDLNLNEYLFAGQQGIVFDDAPNFGKERITFTLKGDAGDYLSIDIDNDFDIYEFDLKVSREYEGSWLTRGWRGSNKIDNHVWVEIITE
jgi:hypothetical protein